MPRRGHALLAIAIGTPLVVAASAGYRSWTAAWRAFRQPELVDPAPPPRPAPQPSLDLGRELDRQLAQDYFELEPGSPFARELELAGALPEELPVPITRRTLRFVRFFTEREKGRRSFEVMYRRSGRYGRNIAHALREAGLPAGLLWLVAAESGFEPGAVSQAGAVGLWQLMPATARDYGLVINAWVDERRSVRRSTEAAVWHLRDLKDELGSLDLAMAAYNLGRQRLREAIDELSRIRAKRGDPPSRAGVAALAREGLLPRETADYVPKITAIAIVASNLERFDMDHLVRDDREHTSPILIPGETKLSTVARAADMSTEELRRLNPELLRARLPAGRSREVRVPAERLDHALMTLPVYLREEREPPGPVAPEPAEPPQADDDPAPPAPRVVLAPVFEAPRFDPLAPPRPRGLVLALPELGGSGDLAPPASGVWERWAPLLGSAELPQAGQRAADVEPPEAPKTQAEREMAEALEEAMSPEERAVGSGITLRVRRDATAARISITVAIEGDRTLRSTRVVERAELDLGLSYAVGRLGLLLEQAGPQPAGALRARLNRHRRVALGELDDGAAWLALSDALFPPGDARFGRLVDPRGVDAAWMRDRVLLADLEADRGAERAVIDVAGDVHPERIAETVTDQIARLGLGVAGHLPGRAAELRDTLRVEAPAPTLLMGWRAPGRHEASYADLLVALEILGGDGRSRLAERFEERVELVVDPAPSGTAAVLDVDLDGLDRQAAIGAVDEALGALREDGPSRRELAYARAILEHRLRRRAERELTSPQLTPWRVLEARRPEAAETLLEALAQVEARDVRRVVSRHLTPAQRIVVLAGPQAPREREMARR